MAVRAEVVLLILGCALVTWVPRVLPLWLLRDATRGFVRLEPALRLVPAAVFSGLIAQEAVQWGPFEWVSSAAALGIAVATRSLFLTVSAGILVRHLMGGLS